MDTFGIWVTAIIVVQALTWFWLAVAISGVERRVATIERRLGLRL